MLKKAFLAMKAS